MDESGVGIMHRVMSISSLCTPALAMGIWSQLGLRAPVHERDWGWFGRVRRRSNARRAATVTQQGGAAPRRPGLPNRRQHQHARFVDEYDVGLLMGGFFFGASSPLGSNGRWPPRHARWSSSAASDMTIPEMPAVEGCDPRGIERRTAARSPGRCEGTSGDRSRTHWSLRPSAAAS